MDAFAFHNRCRGLPVGATLRATVAGMKGVHDVRIVAHDGSGLPVVEIVNGGALTGRTVASGDWHPVGNPS